MPVQKYRSIGDLPALPQVLLEDRAARIRAVWRRATLFGGCDVPRGVTRFGSIDEANQMRTDRTIARMRRRGMAHISDEGSGRSRL